MSNILLCVLLVGLTGIFAAQDYVYELHVTLPPALGQDQTKEMKTIQKIIFENVKREDSYVFKHVAKPEVFAFITVESARIWEDISDALTVRGYVYDVKPLRKAEDYAAEIGIPDFPKPMQAKELDTSKQYSLWRGNLLPKERTNAEYKALILRQFMVLKDIERKTQEICWVVMASEPQFVIAISPYSPRGNDDLEHAYEKDDNVAEQDIDITPVVLLESFKSTDC